MQSYKQFYEGFKTKAIAMGGEGKTVGCRFFLMHIAELTTDNSDGTAPNVRYPNIRTAEVLIEALKAAVLNDQTQFIIQVLSGNLCIDPKPLWSMPAEFPDYYQIDFYQPVIAAAVTHNKLAILDQLLNEKLIKLETVLDITIRSQAISVFNHFTTNVPFEVIQRAITNHTDLIQSIQMIFNSNLSPQHKTALAQSVIKTRPIIIFELILNNEQSMLELIKNSIGEAAFKQALTAPPVPQFMKLPANQAHAHTNLNIFKNNYPEHAALIDTNTLLEIGLSRRWYDFAAHLAIQPPTKIQQYWADRLFDDLFGNISIEKQRLIEWVSKLLPENFSRYATGKLDLIVNKVQSTIIDGKVNSSLIGLIQYLLKNHLTEYGHKIAHILRFLDLDMVFNDPKVLNFYSPNNKNSDLTVPSQDRYHYHYHFIKFAKAKLPHFTDKQQLAVQEQEQIKVLISGLIIEIDAIVYIHDKEKKELMDLCSKYVEIAESMNNPTILESAINQFKKLQASHKQKLTAAKEVETTQIAKQKLINHLQTLISNIELQKYGRKSSGMYSAKVNSIRALMESLEKSHPTQGIQGYIDQARALVAIKRNPLHFWQSPHSVKEFEKMLSELDAPEAPQNKPQ